MTFRYSRINQIMKKFIDSIKTMPIGKKIRFFLAILCELIVLVFLIRYPSWFEVRRFILFLVIPPIFLPREMLAAFYLLYQELKEDMLKQTTENDSSRSSLSNAPLNNTQETVDERKLVLVKEKIIFFYSIEDKKHLGDRLFGYLIKSNIIKVEKRSPRGRSFEYEKMMGIEIKPSDTRFHRKPNESRGISKETMITHLEELHNFFVSIELKDTANVVLRDLSTIKSANVHKH